MFVGAGLALAGAICAGFSIAIWLASQKWPQLGVVVAGFAFLIVDTFLFVGLLQLAIRHLP
jgi:hypothetical protein